MKIQNSKPNTLPAGRRRNEDAVGVFEKYRAAEFAGRGKLFCVADGMGGHRGGDVAAGIAVEKLGKYYKEEFGGDRCPRPTDADDGADQSLPRPPSRGPRPTDAEDGGVRRSSHANDDGADRPHSGCPRPADAEKVLHRLFLEANETILREADANDDLYGMGSTLTAALFIPTPDTRHPTPVLIVAHIGDCRVYRRRGNGQFDFLTRDHTIAQKLVEFGDIEPAEKKGHPGSNRLLRYLGTTDKIEPEIAIHPTRPGDAYLLCTDGLYEVVEDDEIKSFLADATAENLDELSDKIMETALSRKPKDNVSFLLIFVE